MYKEISLNLSPKYADYRGSLDTIVLGCSLIHMEENLHVTKDLAKVFTHSTKLFLPLAALFSNALGIKMNGIQTKVLIRENFL